MSTPNHDFIPRKETDSRSPCPALNTLADHGYIARDGRNLTLPELVNALHEVYNISFPLATILSMVAILLCGHWLTLNLHDLALHDVIEHDGSLVHSDCLPGHKFAPTHPNRERLQRLLLLASQGHGLSLRDFVRARAECDSKLLKPLDAIHSKIAMGESALTWLVMKDQHGEVPVKALWEWYGDERLPEGWTRPTENVGLRSTNAATTKIATQEQGM